MTKRITACLPVLLTLLPMIAARSSCVSGNSADTALAVETIAVFTEGHCLFTPDKAVPHADPE